MKMCILRGLRTVNKTLNGIWMKFNNKSVEGARGKCPSLSDIKINFTTTATKGGVRRGAMKFDTTVNT